MTSYPTTIHKPESQTMSVTEAGRLLGVGRTLAYRLASSGEFPVTVIRLGRTYRVPTAPLLDLLGLGPATQHSPPCDEAVYTKAQSTKEEIGS